MTTAAALTLGEAARMIREAVLDHTWERETRLGPVIVDYLAWKRLSRSAARTLDQYERDLARLAVRCAHIGIEEIAVGDLMLCLQEFPPKSWRRARAAWSGFFTWAVRFGHRETNPMDLLPAIRPEARKLYELFDATERARVLHGAQDSLLPTRDRLGALVFQDLGVRKNEARLLRFGSFDLVNRSVVVLGKGDKERAVPLSDELWTALMDFAHEPIPQVRMHDRRGSFVCERLPTPDDFIFFPSGATRRSQEHVLLWTDPTRPMGETSMHRWWERCVERAGIRYRSLHMNRHTVATELVEAEVDSFSVRDWMGHADVRTTEIYVHNARRRLRGAADRLRLARGIRSAEDETA